MNNEQIAKLQTRREYHLEAIRKIDISLGNSKRYYSKNDIIIRDIKNVVCEFFELTISDLEGPSQKRIIVEPRQIAIYLIMSRAKNVSLAAAGGEFNRDHTTAIHCVKVINNFIETERGFKEKIDELKSRLDLKISEARKLLTPVVSCLSND